MRFTITPEELKPHVEKQIAKLQAEMEKFATRFLGNPAEALEWAQDTFDNAARLEAFQRVRGQLDKGVALEDIIKGHMQQLKNHARAPERSTSQSSNLIERSRLAATSEIIEMLEE